MDNIIKKIKACIQEGKMCADAVSEMNGTGTVMAYDVRIVSFTVSDDEYPLFVMRYCSNPEEGEYIKMCKDINGETCRTGKIPGDTIEEHIEAVANIIKMAERDFEGVKTEINWLGD